jgi:tetratricopeptide (TPR) repeat protein
VAREEAKAMEHTTTGNDAWSLLMEHRWEESISALDELLAGEPDDATLGAIQQAKATALVNLGRVDEAISGLEQAVGARDDDGDLWALLGVLRIGPTGCGRALACFEAASERPLRQYTNEEIRYYIGVCHIGLREYEQARDCFSRLEQEGYEDPLVLFHLGNAETMLDLNESAVRHLSEFIRRAGEDHSSEVEGAKNVIESLRPSPSP